MKFNLSHPLSLLLVLIPWLLATACAKEEQNISYGNNKEVGKFAKINGIKLYYEIYGKGEPLVLIHGNGGSISEMDAQIAHFAKTHQVIAVDSRGHGHSEIGEGKLTYLRMADDYAKLFAHLKLKPAHVLGLSDGGIIGLLLGIHHADSVSKIAAMGANLGPGIDAVYPWAPKGVREMMKIIQGKVDEGDTSQDWGKIQKIMSMLVEQPNISLEQLKTIKSPVLVLAGDRDIIREEHTVLIYQNIPSAHLCIFPGSTHFIPFRNPKLFNQTVEKFLKEPFHRPESKDLFFGSE